MIMLVNHTGGLVVSVLSLAFERFQVRSRVVTSKTKSVSDEDETESTPETS